MPQSIALLGLYSAVALEVVLVLVSIAALRSGSSTISRLKELTAYALAVLIGLIAFVGYLVECSVTDPNTVFARTELYLVESIPNITDAEVASRMEQVQAEVTCAAERVLQNGRE